MYMHVLDVIRAYIHAHFRVAYVSVIQEPPRLSYGISVLKIRIITFLSRYRKEYEY